MDRKWPKLRRSSDLHASLSRVPFPNGTTGQQQQPGQLGVRGVLRPEGLYLLRDLSCVPSIQRLRLSCPRSAHQLPWLPPRCLSSASALSCPFWELSGPWGMSPFSESGCTSPSSLLLCVLLKERALSTRATAVPREGFTLSSLHFVSVHNCHLTGPDGGMCLL